MTHETSSNDDVTDKRLALLVSLVVVAGGIAVVTSLGTAWLAPEGRPTFLVSAGIIAAIAVGSRTQWRIRILSHGRGISWPEVGVLVGLAVMPPVWVIICTCAAIAIAKFTAGLTLQKAFFGVGHDVLGATAAALVFAALEVPHNVDDPQLRAGALALATLAMWLVDESLVVPVIALATRVSLRQSLRANWDMRLIGTVARYVVAALVIGILSLGGDARLLLLVVPLVMCMHLWQTAQIRNREERRSWQRLAEATDELNVTDLTAVLAAGVTRTAQLFSVDEVDIELLLGDTKRLVRGSSDGLRYDGPTAAAPARDGAEIVRRLAGHDGSNPMGELRLRLSRSVKLSGSENYKLQTFASALYTAIRNAAAYAELERISAEHAYDAAHDPLTGLANRRELLDQAGRMFTERPDEGMLALLLIDLNHFKEVNDTLGHAAGDEVLREVAVRLQSAARPADLVARLGGDEFAVLLTGLPSPAMARHRAETLLAALDHTIDVDGMRLTVEACGGIALAPGSGGVTELLRRADVAMYQAKRSGTRTADYAHSRDTADVGRLMLGGEVRRAVAELEFSVDFQPIVDLGSGEVVAAEALARWHHPEHGDLTPMQFLETIERSGQLPAFADAVLEQSLAAADAWREAGFDIPVAVNVSPRSLLDPDFPEAVRSRLSNHGVPSDRLVLELAETLTISQLEVVERALVELRDAGVRLVLDDFGAGVSPLSVLSRIPVHQLKIGREFVAAVETSTEAAAVIRSTVDLARSMHLTVIADGVESEPQRAALWELGCVAGQGHLFARPMRGGRLLAALQRGTGGRPGVLAGALHDVGSVVRLPRRRPPGPHRSSLPHLPA
ncbi:bifunctional diguanylate cyclase/phosphodiesterase [Actinoplanes sp. NPDC051470]|uniref:putative bifunctional diguanylate cyclase/phosphodiesterase n=1 Tax=unclassified Actinoplanes TaxID=2626549 RepID=UPI003412F1C6